MKDHSRTCPVEPAEDLVEEEFGCPRRDERRVAWLKWLEEDSEHMECQTCYYIYEP